MSLIERANVRLAVLTPIRRYRSYIMKAHLHEKLDASKSNADYCLRDRRDVLY